MATWESVAWRASSARALAIASVSLVTKRPWARSATVSPSASSLLSARWTVLGLTPASMASSRTLGILEAGVHWPEAIFWLKASTSWIQMGRVSSKRISPPFRITVLRQ